MNTSELVNYHHVECILRFQEMFDIPVEETKIIFEDMKKLLALLNEYSDSEYVFTHEPLWIVDEMWHTFLLYTKDYREFCIKYFGRQIDHLPTKLEIKNDIAKKLEQKDEDITQLVTTQVKRLYELIYDFLGPETLVRWIKYYGEKYTIPYINSIRKPIR